MSEEELKARLATIAGVFGEKTAGEVKTLSEPILALRSDLEKAEKALRDLLVYTTRLEQAYSVWVASRPYMAAYPDGAKEIGNQAREVLGITLEEWRVYFADLEEGEKGG